MADNKSIESAKQVMFEQVYVPAYVATYNEKAAALNMPLIQDEATLQQALALTEAIELSKAANAKTQVNPIAAAFNKLSSASKPSSDYAAIVNSFAKQAAANPEVLSALKLVTNK